jgi:hypothetical protein
MLDEISGSYAVSIGGLSRNWPHTLNRALRRAYDAGLYVINVRPKADAVPAAPVDDDDDDGLVLAIVCVFSVSWILVRNV